MDILQIVEFFLQDILRAVRSDSGEAIQSSVQMGEDRRSGRSLHSLNVLASLQEHFPYPVEDSAQEDNRHQKRGLMMQDTNNAPNIVMHICPASNIAFGSNSSIAPMSFENLLSIRPLGFVSKNLMPVLMSALNAMSCSFWLHIMHKL